MARPLWFVKLIKHFFPSRFFLAKLTKIPLIGRLIKYLMFEGDKIIYLPKDKTIQLNQSLDPPGNMALPSKVVEYFIEKARYHWIMNFCICRDSMQCKDYPIDLGCLFLGEAVLGINSQLGRRVTKEEALEHIRLCREAGLVHLIGRNKLDALWLGVGPGNKLMTICHCCPCCCLWKMLPHLNASISANVTKMPGVTVTVTDRCQGCGSCTKGICFVNAIHIENERAVITDACRGCGRCVDVCPNNAIELSVDINRALEKSISRLSPLVDVT